MILQVKKNIKEQMKIHNSTTAEVLSRLHEGKNYINSLTDEVKAIKLQRIAHAIGCTLHDLTKGL